MEPFKTLNAVAAPLPIPNVDTDQVTPARFLWRKRSDGWGQLLFNDLRFNDDGSPKSKFVLNRPEFRDARILVAGRNFGCGSSREHAVWALYDYGIRAVIAPSFGDIFYSNSLQNGLLPVVLPAPAVDAFLAGLESAPGTHIEVDLEAQHVLGPDGSTHRFEIDPFRKSCLIAGADEVAFTLSLGEQLDAFENAYERNVSWL
jgi:3-isopropylmalate/(R)-2-methylmalate dehydratase small subunit